MKRIIDEIKGTLEVEKQTFSDGGETDDVVRGWIEGLEYVLSLLDDEHDSDNQDREAVLRYFKKHGKNSPQGNELAIRKSDLTVIDVTLTEELARDEGIDYNSDEYCDKLHDSELEKLSERLNQIETEQKLAWGLHRISGGFVKAEFDDVDGDKIHITITDGVQSDCDNSVNTTHCSLWRDTLEYTD